MGSSPTSSRKMVPPSASAKAPSRSPVAQAGAVPGALVLDEDAVRADLDLEVVARHGVVAELELAVGVGADEQRPGERDLLAHVGPVDDDEPQLGGRGGGGLEVNHRAA